MRDVTRCLLMSSRGRGRLVRLRPRPRPRPDLSNPKESHREQRDRRTPWRQGRLPAGAPVQDLEGPAAPAGAGLRGSDLGGLGPQQPGPGQPAADVHHRPPGRHRLPVHPAGGPGHRALGRRELRQEPDLLRLREHREAGDRRRLQRGRLDLRRARRRSRASTRTRSRSS